MEQQIINSLYCNLKSITRRESCVIALGKKASLGDSEAGDLENNAWAEQAVRAQLTTSRSWGAKELAIFSHPWVRIFALERHAQMKSFEAASGSTSTHAQLGAKRPPSWRSSPAETRKQPATFCRGNPPSELKLMIAGRTRNSSSKLSDYCEGSLEFKRF